MSTSPCRPRAPACATQVLTQPEFAARPDAGDDVFYCRNKYNYDWKRFTRRAAAACVRRGSLARPPAACCVPEPLALTLSAASHRRRRRRHDNDIDMCDFTVFEEQNGEASDGDFRRGRLLCRQSAGDFTPHRLYLR